MVAEQSKGGLRPEAREMLRAELIKKATEQILALSDNALVQEWMADE